MTDELAGRAGQGIALGVRARRSWWLDIGWRVIRNPQGAIGVAILGCFLLVAIFAAQLAPYGQREQIAGARLLSPSWHHLFGTDELGRDVFSRTLFGLRASLAMSLVSVTAGALAGSVIGFSVGYIRGWIEATAMRLVDTMLAFPSLLAGIALITILGTGFKSVTLAIALFNIPVFARLSRAGALVEAGKDYVLAERNLGASDTRILFRHIVLNAMSPIWVQLGLAYAFAVLVEASLSFLGLGVQPPNASLGSLIQTGRGFLYQNVWYAVAPGIVLSLLVVSFNFLADALNEASDPRRRRR